jgi:hypothetical protein
MAEALNPTAWGEGVLEVGTPGTGDTLATTFEDIGYILDDSIGVAAEDGTALELRSWGNVLRDYQATEKTFTITGTLIGITASAMAKFWNIDTATTAGRTAVKSTVTNQKFSFRMGTPAVVGSDRLNVPTGRMSLGMAYAQGEGWTAPFTIQMLVGATGNIFEFDTVPEPTPEG